MPQRTRPCPGFDGQAEEAVRHHATVGPNSRGKAITHCGVGMPVPAGTVLTGAFDLDGEDGPVLNGGPPLPLDHTVCFSVSGVTPAEIAPDLGARCRRRRVRAAGPAARPLRRVLAGPADAAGGVDGRPGTPPARDAGRVRHGSARPRRTAPRRRGGLGCAS